MRWAGPALCLLAAAWVLGALLGGDAWVLVGIDRAVGPDPERQARWTAALLALVGVGWAVAAWRQGPDA